MERWTANGFERLKNAILQKQVLKILYCGTSGDTSERKVKPFKLIFKDKHWYLQAFCLKADDFRVFKVSRIIELSATDEHFTETFQDAPPMEMELPPLSCTAIKLWFSPAVAFRLYDEFDNSVIEKQPDGSFLAAVNFPLDSWVYSYLLSFGTEIKILEPAEMRTQVAAYAKKIYEHHKT